MSHSDEMTLDKSYNPDRYTFTREEVQALWRVLKHHYINYEDLEANKVATRIGKIVDELAQ